LTFQSVCICTAISLLCREDFLGPVRNFTLLLFSGNNEW
jgi:hypothetical protein